MTTPLSDGLLLQVNTNMLTLSSRLAATVVRLEELSERIDNLPDCATCGPAQAILAMQPKVDEMYDDRRFWKRLGALCVAAFGTAGAVGSFVWAKAADIMIFLSQYQNP